jgi:DNA-binding XRE family transcriptional regulator
LARLPEGRGVEREPMERPRRAADRPSPDRHGDAVAVQPLYVVSQNFPARPSSIPEIREFVVRHLADSPLTAEEGRGLHQAVLAALLDAANPDGGSVQVSFRFFPEGVEVDVLRSPASTADLPGRVKPVAPEERSFAEWLARVLKREGLTQEAAARQLGVSVKTVSRWVGGETEPRLRDLRRIHEVFGEAPIG